MAGDTAVREDPEMSWRDVSLLLIGIGVGAATVIGVCLLLGWY